MCDWYFWTANIVGNIIWDTTSGIRDKVRVKAMAREEGKALGIEKFDRLWVLEDANRRLSLWEEVTSASFGDETWYYERWRMESSW